MTPIEKLRSYAIRYHNSYIIDDGVCQWRMNQEQKVCARVAKKAIELGMEVTYYDCVLIVHY